MQKIADYFKKQKETCYQTKHLIKQHKLHPLDNPGHEIKRSPALSSSYQNLDKTFKSISSSNLPQISSNHRSHSLSVDLDIEYQLEQSQNCNTIEQSLKMRQKQKRNSVLEKQFSVPVGGKLDIFNRHQETLPPNRL